MLICRNIWWLITLLLFVAGCGGTPTGDPRLEGTFVSDRAASVAFLESTGNYDADKLESFGSVFGKTEITYQGDKRTTVIDGQAATHQFTVVDSGPDHVTTECKWSKEERALMGEDSDIERIEFTDDGFWLGKSQIPMDRFKEKFVRKELAASSQP